jgi:phosphoglycerate dehydrogenase-like enzyme
MRIIFHGANAASFSPGFADLVGLDAEIIVLPDVLSAEDRATYASADVIVSTKFDAGLPRPDGLKLLHVPGAGYDAVDLDAVPGSAVVCNCFGHEQAIAEYVMAALLRRQIPLEDADRRLRQGDWAYWAGAPERVHGEIAGSTIGLLGFGHIGKAIAARAKAFEMTVHVANRSPVAPSALVDRAYGLNDLPAFWASADAFVVSVPLTAETTGIVGADAFAAMRPEAVVINVGRGATIDEAALYEALKTRRIAGAMIDTWYRYPSPGTPNPQPAALPFAALSNLLMTPHMSGWTNGTITRRQKTIADNVRRRLSGQPCVNQVRDVRPGS